MLSRYVNVYSYTLTITKEEWQQPQTYDVIVNIGHESQTT